MQDQTIDIIAPETLAPQRDETKEEAQRRLLVVLVPAYNEESSIGATIDGLKRIEPALSEVGYRLQVLVVNDGSADATERVAKDHNVDIVVRHNRNQGLGAAVRTGLKEAQRIGADIVVKFDADLQHVPEEIVSLIEPIVSSDSDIVYGKRALEYSMPAIRKIGNQIFTGLMARLTGWPIEDSQPGIFAVNKTFLDDFYLPGNYNYTQQVLLDACYRDLRFSQVPVTFKERRGGRSFVSLKYPLRVIPQIVMLLISVKPLQVFGGIGAIFLLAMSIVAGWDLAAFLLGGAEKPIQHVNAVLGFGFMGIQSIYFGFLAHLVVEFSKRRRF